MAKKYGQYLVVEGKNMRPKPGAQHPTNFVQFDYNMTYVIHLPSKKVVGKYAQEQLAHNCGQFLDNSDRKKADEAMEKILRGEE